MKMKKFNAKSRSVFYFLVFLAFVLFIIFVMQFVEVMYSGNIAMLFPKGVIALKQRNLLFVVQALMLLVIIPVYFLFFLFAWKYHAGHSTAKYDPEIDDHPIAEVIWWGVPCVIVLIISILIYVWTYRLDPYKPIVSDKKPMKIQVVALQWKWLFLYPEQQIATVNFVQFPEGTPVHFEITADAPMNSFWIPQLGGQIFAMPMMRTELHLIADEEGEYRGSSANISGQGFAEMHFIAKASSQDDFDQWVLASKDSTSSLTFDTYQKLAKPSIESEGGIFQLGDDQLFEKIIMKYMPQVHSQGS